ncbi:hypothetical protein, partial [Pseudomonas glycinae]|uniref:hypothetical protein n=1 Tax=Pseudomonas glycinae TaxID=1785145 RepID=UPI001E3B41CE
MAILRKKLRTCFVKMLTDSAEGHVFQGLQPSAQEVAQYCAKKWAHEGERRGLKNRKQRTTPGHDTP